MAVEPAEWEKITPDELIPAIKHIRKSFDDSVGKRAEVTQKLCYAALHPGEVAATALAPYEANLPTIRAILGFQATQQFEAQRNYTLASIFKAYSDAYRLMLQAEVRSLFQETLKIAVANTGKLNLNPVEWAKSHLLILIRQERYRVKHWVKSACDRQQYTGIPDLNDEEWVYWNSWRAPKLIHMQPSGNTPYDSATAWDREDEPRTRQLLEGLPDRHNRRTGGLVGRFIQFMEVDLEEIGGQEHVKLAQRQAVESAPSAVVRTPANSNGTSAIRSSPVTDSKTFFENIVVAFLRDKGWSVDRFAKEAGLDRHTVNDYMNGKTKPFPATKAAIAKTLGIKVSDMP